jgi:hypothetical protein
MMTKRHFNGLAAAIAAETRWHDSDKDSAVRDALGKVAREIADFCAGENPNFDRRRFLAACRVESD